MEYSYSTDFTAYPDGFVQARRMPGNTSENGPGDPQSSFGGIDIAGHKGMPYPSERSMGITPGLFGSATVTNVAGNVYASDFDPFFESWLPKYPDFSN